jgi:hypothetical protein
MTNYADGLCGMTSDYAFPLQIHPSRWCSTSGNPSQEEINSLSGARLPYVSIELTSETDPAHSVKTFGLLDSGSSLLLIDSALLASNEVFYQPETAQTDVISFSGNKIRTVGTCKFSVDFGHGKSIPIAFMIFSGNSCSHQLILGYDLFQ